MDDAELGRVFRALRIGRGLRQVDLAARASTSHDVVSLLERGAVDRLSVRLARALFLSMGAPLKFRPRMPTADRPTRDLGAVWFLPISTQVRPYAARERVRLRRGA